MKIVRGFYALILIILIFGSIGIPKGFHLTKAKVNAATVNCLHGGQSGKYNSSYCCGGSYAVELTSSKEGKDFICLDMKDYPLES